MRAYPRINLSLIRDVEVRKALAEQDKFNRQAAHAFTNSVNQGQEPTVIIRPGQIITDHGALLGLLDDDHPQYLTQARGDARYPLTAGLGQLAYFNLDDNFIAVSDGGVGPWTGAHIFGGITTPNIALQTGGWLTINIENPISGRMFGSIDDLDTGYSMYLACQSVMAGGYTLYFPGDGGVLMTTSAVQNVTNKTFVGGCTLNASSTNVIKNNTNGPIFQDNTTSTKKMRIDLSGASASTTMVLALSATANATITFPSASSTLATLALTETFSNKTLDTSTKINCDTSTGATFRDNSDTTKTMRFDLSGIAASTNRNKKVFNQSSTLVEVGNNVVTSGGTGTAGSPSKIDLTGQTGSMASTVLVKSPADGLYRVSVYAYTTATGTAGSMLPTVSYNDGTSRTGVGVPCWDAALTPGATLSLASITSLISGCFIIYSSGGTDIVAQSVVSGASGSPQYTIRWRVEHLG